MSNKTFNTLPILPPLFNFSATNVCNMVNGIKNKTRRHSEQQNKLLQILPPYTSYALFTGQRALG